MKFIAGLRARIYWSVALAVSPLVAMGLVIQPQPGSWLGLGLLGLLSIGIGGYAIDRCLGRQMRANESSLQGCRARLGEAEAASRQATESLRQRSEELTALLDTIPIPIWMARGADGREVVGNRAGRQWLGLPEGANVSLCNEEKPPLRLYGVDGRELVGEELPIQRAARQGRTLRDVEVEIRLDDGRRLWALESAVPLFDAAGAVRGVLATTLDISERKQTEEALRRHRDQLENRVAERTYELAVAKEAAERANRSKSSFLANISRELRLPLNNLLRLARSLSGDEASGFTPQQQEAARSIELSGLDLIALIDELLDLAQIEIGRLDLQIKAVPFPEVMQSLRRTHGLAAKDKGLEFKMEIDADVPATISTDPQRLEQLLCRLLSNAIKFTEAGAIILRISRAVSGWRAANPALSATAGVIAFDVIDTGIGIDRVRQQEILEAPDILAGETPDLESGGGLGLTISGGIAALLGGELKVASMEGAGSTFTVYLPAEYAGPVKAPTMENLDKRTAGLETPTASA